MYETIFVFMILARIQKLADLQKQWQLLKNVDIKKIDCLVTFLLLLKVNYAEGWLCICWKGIQKINVK